MGKNMFCSNCRFRRSIILKWWSWCTVGFFLKTVDSNTTGVFGFEKELLKRAASVRKKIGTNFPSHDELFYPSAYAMRRRRPRTTMFPPQQSESYRGFCNWIIPNYIMVGQYPGQNPEVSGPTHDDVQSHIESLIQDAGIRLFCCLQSETPPQTDDDAWADGGVYLPAYHRQDFPNPFTQYAPIVRSALYNNDNNPNSNQNDDCIFLHTQIEDLSVPNSKSLSSILTQLLVKMDDENRTIYVHCWGGRGRAGIVASCLLSLIWPELDASAILDHVQAGYQSRLGHDEIPPVLSRSPQTEAQRQFVRTFVKERQRAHQTETN